MIKPPNKKYCSYCGTECSISLIWVGDEEIHHYDFRDFKLASRYDQNTGQKNYYYRCYCPDYKYKQGAMGLTSEPIHDNYLIGEVIRQD